MVIVGYLHLININQLAEIATVDIKIEQPIKKKLTL
jgi:hypothetical protein